MSSAPPSWSIVTFTSDDAALAALAALQPRLPGMRFAAVVPAPMIAPGDVAVLVDQEGHFADGLGVTGTRTYVMDGRGTVTQSWSGVPEYEAVAVYATKPPLPSGAPAWLFPVLAAAVLIVGIGAWAATRPSAAPAPAPAVVAAAPAPAPAPVAAPAAAPAAPTDAAEAEGDVADDAAPAGAPAAAPAAGPGGRRRGPQNAVGDWIVLPREKAQAVATVEGDTLTLKALAGEVVTACRTATPLKGQTHFSAEWKLDNVTGKAARILIRQLGADKKPIHDATARTMLARGHGSSKWGTPTAEVKPAAGAVAAQVCVDVAEGSGTVSVRKITP